jgi:hypothetical protein
MTAVSSDGVSRTYGMTNLQAQLIQFTRGYLERNLQRNHEISNEFPSSRRARAVDWPVFLWYSLEPGSLLAGLVVVTMVVVITVVKFTGRSLQPVG